MPDTERDPFDEFDDELEAVEAEEAATAEAERDLRASIEGEEASAEPDPVPAEPEPVPSNSPYPTEEPDDPSVLWSPRPGIVGCKLRGYKKIK